MICHIIFLCNIYISTLLHNHDANLNFLIYLHDNFFTIELKVVKSGNKVRLSPHEISFHIRHPKNTFILVKDVKKKRFCMYLGSQIYELVENGLKTKPITEDFKTYLECLF